MIIDYRHRPAELGEHSCVINVKMNVSDKFVAIKRLASGESEFYQKPPVLYSISTVNYSSKSFTQGCFFSWSVYYFSGVPGEFEPESMVDYAHGANDMSEVLKTEGLEPAKPGERLLKDVF